MKNLNQYIKESILDDEELINDTKILKPKTYDELVKAIKHCLDHQIYDLNCIDTSKITNMGGLFAADNQSPLRNYNISVIKQINISEWDVSNVENMRFMFSDSYFNGDISKWDVSNVKDMKGMFSHAEFNGDISKWDVSNVKDMDFMFYRSKFKGNISKWKVSTDTYTDRMFNACPLKNNPLKWYKK